MKDGIRTSEFALTALAVVCTTVLAALGQIDGAQALSIIGPAAVYTASRTTLKSRRSGDDA